MSKPYPFPGVWYQGPTRVYRRGGTVEVLLVPSFRLCTVFLYGVRRGELKPRGTAFIVAEPVVGRPDMRRPYVVTARHVIEQIRRSTDDHLIHIRVNDQVGGAFWHTVPIEDWFFHPNDKPELLGDEWLTPAEWKRYDVAATPCPYNIIDNGRIVVIPTDYNFVDDELISRERIAPGDDVAITGLYHKHYGRERNIPIVRSGIIAALPEGDGDEVDTGLGPMDAYLIETRSTGGLSGSPVFWLSGFQRVGTPDDPARVRTLSNSMSRFFGFIQGHYDTRIDNEKLNDGIAQVVPARHIVETLRQEAIVARNNDEDRRAQAAERDAAEEATGTASMDAVDDDAEERVSLHGVDPEDALRALLRTPPHGQTQDPA